MHIRRLVSQCGLFVRLSTRKNAHTWSLKFATLDGSDRFSSPSTFAILPMFPSLYLSPSRLLTRSHTHAGTDVDLHYWCREEAVCAHSLNSSSLLLEPLAMEAALGDKLPLFTACLHWMRQGMQVRTPPAAHVGILSLIIAHPWPHFILSCSH